MAQNNPSDSEKGPLDFGLVLEDVMFSRELTDSSLAALLGKDRTTVYKWRTEGRIPDARTVSEIIKELKLSPEESERLAKAAGYLITFGVAEAREPSSTDSPPPADHPPTPVDVNATDVPEPPILQFDLTEDLLNPKPKPDPQTRKKPINYLLKMVVVAALVCAILCFCLGVTVMFGPVFHRMFYAY